MQVNLNEKYFMKVCLNGTCVNGFIDFGSPVMIKNQTTAENLKMFLKSM